MKVLLVTSWGTPQCGIQAHSEALIPAVTAADSSIVITPSAEALNADHLLWQAKVALTGYDLIHLNYHRALHSRWTPQAIRTIKEASGLPVVITHHDVFGELPPDQLTQELDEVADALVVHEPCEGLPGAIYWRQGVPTDGEGRVGMRHGCRVSRPILGTVGFDFGWKNYDRVCVLAAKQGWGVLLYVPEMTAEREADLRRLNPWLEVRRNQPVDEVIPGLRECDATAFLYVCGNSGTSAAIRLGIAAGKPVVAYSTCRQFRDLRLDPVGATAITWVETEDHVESVLQGMVLTRLDPDVVRLAAQDSWTGLGVKYAALYQAMVAAKVLA